jgi:hypothetical protein
MSSQPESITCSSCGMTSYSPDDIGAGYCGRCHDWTGVTASDERISQSTDHARMEDRGLLGRPVD